MGESPLNNLFEKTYVLNLLTRKDKLDVMKKYFDNNNVRFDVFKAVTPMDILTNPKYSKFKGAESRRFGAIACAMSWKSMLEKALKNKYKSILIFEDDIVFCDNFNTKLSEKLTTLPEDWNILHLGYSRNQSFIYHNNLVNFRKINDDWETFDGMAGIFCWGFKSEIIPLVLQYIEKYPIQNILGSYHIDLNLTFMELYKDPRVKVYSTIEPLITHEMIGQSNTGLN